MTDLDQLDALAAKAEENTELVAWAYKRGYDAAVRERDGLREAAERFVFHHDNSMLGEVMYCNGKCKDIDALRTALHREDGA